MKIVIAGGTGFIGQSIIRNWPDEQVNFHILSTNHSKCGDNIHYWDGQSLGEWIEILKDTDVLINLAGRSVNCRYTQEHMEEILNSRINSTKVLNKALSLLDNPPPIWINAGTGTIYRNEYQRPNTEQDGILGEGFSVEVAKAWENEFFKAKTPNIRMVALRTGFVLGKEGDLFQTFKKHTLLGLNKKHGSGKQMISWVHELDVVRAIYHILLRPNLNGVVNVCTPNSLTDKDFLTVFRKKLSVKFGIPMPLWMLNIGAFICKSEVELLLKSRWYYPEKLIDDGFEFEYPDLESCLDNLINGKDDFKEEFQCH